MVTIVKKEPHPSVIKEVICRHCGCTLEYVPADVQSYTYRDYGHGTDTTYYIKCPNCETQIFVKNPAYK